MAQKCVHRGCDKAFTDDQGPCHYHPGPPDFHEGLKGWKCCTTRVMTFEEFMSIPPCTTGEHSTTDHPPAVEKPDHSQANFLAQQTAPTVPRAPIAMPTATEAVPIEVSESDDMSLYIKDGTTCRRRGCEQQFKTDQDRSTEKCVYHPGAPLFHEGSKGYTCCKRRVLEFDQFLKLEGCKTKGRHLFIGKSEKKVDDEILTTLRSDYYQTPSSMIASFFLKKINPTTARVTYPTPATLHLDLTTTDTPPKRFKQDITLFGPVDVDKSRFTVMGTKLECEIVKAEMAAWPVLRADERRTGEILQVGRAGNA